MKNNLKELPLVATMTGELFQPCRLYYEVSDIHAVEAVFSRMKCMDYDKTSQRWVWLYHEESRYLKFPKTYREIPVHMRPIVLGSFFKVNDQHIHLDVRSCERVVQAIQFFDKRIPRKAAMAPFVSIYNKLTRGNPSNPQNQFDDLFTAIPSPSSHFIEDVERIAQTEPDREKRLALIHELIEKQERDSYPLTETLPINFYEDGILQLQSMLLMRQLEAIQHDSGNNNYRARDLIQESLGMDPKVPMQAPDGSRLYVPKIQTPLIEHDYPDPVSRLLTMGEPRTQGNYWFDYLGIGLTTDHISILIHMATDQELHQADQDSLDVWAPLHAWRALGQLRAEDAVVPLLQLLEDQEGDYDDWLLDDLPMVFGMIGQPAIAPVVQMLGTDIPAACRTLIANALGEIGRRHSFCRDECVGILTRQLEQYEANDAEFNAFLIWGLDELEATESMEQIRQAYARRCVDISIMGDLEDVEVLMGVRDKRVTARPLYNQLVGPMTEKRTQFSTMSSIERAPKVGRNDPCPCGSGQKYKRCGHPLKPGQLAKANIPRSIICVPSKL
ncbi:MAG: SEC-C domain-containing protein, partial [Magnetococcales bacterium]|nr:SEC-C domain-containing protein [Magnetococcales bacterium]